MWILEQTDKNVLQAGWRAGPLSVGGMHEWEPGMMILGHNSELNYF